MGPSAAVSTKTEGSPRANTADRQGPTGRSSWRCAAAPRLARPVSAFSAGQLCLFQVRGVGAPEAGAPTEACDRRQGGGPAAPFVYCGRRLGKEVRGGVGGKARHRDPPLLPQPWRRFRLRLRIPPFVRDQRPVHSWRFGCCSRVLRECTVQSGERLYCVSHKQGHLPARGIASSANHTAISCTRYVLECLLFRGSTMRRFFIFSTFCAANSTEARSQRSRIPIPEVRDASPCDQEL